MVSNVYSNEIEKVEIWKKGNKKIIDRPKIIGIYNKYKGGVDLYDQIISAYEFERKVYKWRKRIFYHLLDIAIVSSYIINKHYHQSISKFDYRMLLVKELIEEGNEYRKKNSFCIGKESSYP